MKGLLPQYKSPSNSEDKTGSKIDELLANISYYKAKVEEHLSHGYDEEERARHEDGKYHKQFLSDERELAKAVHEFLELQMK